MSLIRPIKLDDLDALCELAGSSTGGLTSLPQDRDLLREKIECSLFAFGKWIPRPNGESYLFALEEEGQVIGCSAILAKSGGYEPVYAYQLTTQARHSTFLGVNRRIRTLELQRIHNGPTELTSLYLSRHERGSGSGRLLSLARFLFIGAFPDRFDSAVMASLRGVIRSDGSCPFWDAICHPFFRIDFLEANRRRLCDPRFIEELMPTSPLYVDLLPQAARKLIGKAHTNTTPALAMLADEGMRYQGLVDIFDGGPFVTSPMQQIRAIRERKTGHVAIGDGEEEYLLANDHSNFRATLDRARVDGDQLYISEETAAVLQLGVGDAISYVRSHP